MRKILVALALVAATSGAFAQKNPGKSAATTKPATATAKPATAAKPATPATAKKETGKKVH